VFQDAARRWATTCASGSAGRRDRLGREREEPGDGMLGQPIELSLARLHTSDEMDAYERLLGDAMDGDATLFARQDAVEAAWSIVGPLLRDGARRSPTRPAAGARRSRAPDGRAWAAG
jgi:glucose-6-phosphate 1-dehydrogenase